jgi:Xaa-Pro aminopeptidase
MLHFTKQELARRRRAACREMAKQGLDGLLIFRQESMYYLTGYDTSGYSMFQGMYLGADGALALCTRSADLRQARLTSVIEDVRIWRDREGANPADDLRDMLDSYCCRGKRLGVEYHAYGLTAQRGQLVDAALRGFCRTEDASDLVRLLRLVKSPAELAYVRRAGQLADEALAVANRLTVPGARVGQIYGEMQKVILAGDGDPSASRWPMGSGEEALLVRYHTGHGTVRRTDQVMFEFAAAYRHYTPRSCTSCSQARWTGATATCSPRASRPSMPHGRRSGRVAPLARCSTRTRERSRRRATRATT